MNTTNLKLPMQLPGHSSQSGVALITALILLVIITILGLAAVRSATIQQRLSGNFYDREMAFQSAEAALKAGASTLDAVDANVTAAPPVVNPNVVYCNAGAACVLNPFTNTDNLTAAQVNAVTTGTDADQFTTADNAAGQPQYIIQYMGQGVAPPNTNNNCLHSTNAGQYGGGNTCGNQKAAGTQPNYYRITARSGDPADTGNRAEVTLQAIYMQ